ncbi:MAG: amidinotransferase [Lewinellaceae bacterium]|nr:amidinotransferase [Saprospiraceae bacterium]MCB9340283.1 amidinotransferase [Lewinellaceae bacterium]
MSNQSAQTTSHLLMVRPASFGFNEETAANNAFQSNDGSLGKAEISQQAVAEFDAFVEKLRSHGVDVVVAEDSAFPTKPDAVFPNNWITFHEDGTVYTYPMFAPARRVERQEGIVKQIGQKFRINRKVQLEEFESIDQYLEGTGSMIFDRQHHLVYACLSPRTSPELLQRFCKQIRYEPVAFHALDAHGQEIYHTNVMMALGETFVVICLETIRDEEERELLLDKFEETQKDVIEISLEQMSAFAGNMLQVRNASDGTLLVMSQQAYQSLTPEQVAKIQSHTEILFSPIPTIEKYGGGSARCMMAEIFLPQK